MERKMKIKKEKGSVLVLTIIAVLILSIMVTGLLNVGTTEIYTTQNFHLNKVAYYIAVEGVEDIRNRISNNPDPESVSAIAIPPPTDAYASSGGGYQSYYITGSLADMESQLLSGTSVVLGGEGDLPEGEAIVEFSGFEPPPLPAISLGGGSSIEPIVWKVQVTSTIRANKRSTYSEVVTGVYSVLTVGY
jgi:hypothetical protein